MAAHDTLGQAAPLGAALPVEPELPAFVELLRLTSLTSWSWRSRTIVVATPSWLGAQPLRMSEGPLLAAVPAVAGILALRRSRQRALTGRCVNCGYDLRGSAGRCPECGLQIR